MFNLRFVFSFRTNINPRISVVLFFMTCILFDSLHYPSMRKFMRWCLYFQESRPITKSNLLPVFDVILCGCEKGFHTEWSFLRTDAQTVLYFKTERQTHRLTTHVLKKSSLIQSVCIWLSFDLIWLSNSSLFPSFPFLFDQFLTNYSPIRMSLMYRTLVGIGDRIVPKQLRPLWQHEAGPKTIFFWAPAFKWVCFVMIESWSHVMNQSIMYVGSCDSIHQRHFTPSGKGITDTNSSTGCNGSHLVPLLTSNHSQELEPLFRQHFCRHHEPLSFGSCYSVPTIHQKYWACKRQYGWCLTVVVVVVLLYAVCCMSSQSHGMSWGQKAVVMMVLHWRWEEIESLFFHDIKRMCYVFAAVGQNNYQVYFCLSFKLVVFSLKFLSVFPSETTLLLLFFLSSILGVHVYLCLSLKSWRNLPLGMNERIVSLSVLFSPAY